MKQVLLHFAIFLRFKLLLNNLQRTLAQYTKMFKYFERQFFSINQWTWLSGIDINGIKKNDGYCIWTIAVFSVLYLNAQMLKKKNICGCMFSVKHYVGYDATSYFSTGCYPRSRFFLNFTTLIINTAKKHSICNRSVAMRVHTLPCFFFNIYSAWIDKRFHSIISILCKTSKNCLMILKGFHKLYRKVSVLDDRINWICAKIQCFQLPWIYYRHR